MKNFFLLFAVLLLSVRCTFNTDPREVLYESTWTVTNSTKQPLMIVPPPFGNVSDYYYLVPGDEVGFYSRKEFEYKPYFGMVMVCWRGVPEEDVSFDILDADGNLLKKWEWKSANDAPNNSSERNFFRSSSWEHFWIHKKVSKLRAEDWSFEIRPEDIR